MLLSCLAVLCGQIKSRAVKELFERGRDSERPWVKGISFYLTAAERDLLEIDSVKGITDPVKRSFLCRPEWCCFQVAGGRCSACPLPVGFF